MYKELENTKQLPLQVQKESFNQKAWPIASFIRKDKIREYKTKLREFQVADHFGLVILLYLALHCIGCVLQNIGHSSY